MMWIIQLDDDLIDCLLERSPKFRIDCETIRKQMRVGKFTTLGDAERLFAGE